MCQTTLTAVLLSFITHSLFFFFNDTATTEIYTLSLHDALPICSRKSDRPPSGWRLSNSAATPIRSEEHTSELQSRGQLVCRLLLETKKIASIPRAAELSPPTLSSSIPSSSPL